MTAFGKDILRTIRGSLKRFVSIAAICALGATMLTSLGMACLDLRAAADALYDRQRLFDISVQSTLGLTQDDVDELARVEGVEAAEGAYEETTYTLVDGLRCSVSVKALLASGMNEPYVVEGRLPEAAGEVVVTEKYLKDTDKEIGDALEFDDAEQDDPTGLSDEPQPGAIPGGSYTIVGTIVDPANITQPDGPIAFRASTSNDYTFFVHPDAVSPDSTFTACYLAVEGVEGLSAYSDAYADRVGEVQDRVEDLAPQRERARTSEIKDDAYAEIDDEEADALDTLDDAERELDDAQATIDESLAEALSGQRELDVQRADALHSLASAQAEIDDGTRLLADKEADALAGLETISSMRTELQGQLSQLDELEGYRDQAAAGVEQARQAGDALVAGIPDQAVKDAWEALSTWDQPTEPVDEKQAFEDAVGSYADTLRSQLTAFTTIFGDVIARGEQVSNRMDQIDERTGQIDERLEQIDERIRQITDALADLAAGDPAASELNSELADLQREQGDLSSERGGLEAEREALQTEYDSPLNGSGLTMAAVMENFQKLSEGSATLDGAIQSGSVGELAQGMGQAASGLAQIDAAIDAAIAQVPGASDLDDVRETVQAGLSELDASEQEVRAGLSVIAAGREQLAQGQAELDSQRASALEQLEAAQRQIDDGLAQNRRRPDGARRGPRHLRDRARRRPRPDRRCPLRRRRHRGRHLVRAGPQRLGQLLEHRLRRLLDRDHRQHNPRHLLRRRDPGEPHHRHPHGGRGARAHRPLQGARLLQGTDPLQVPRVHHRSRAHRQPDRRRRRLRPHPLHTPLHLPGHVPAAAVQPAVQPVLRRARRGGVRRRHRRVHVYHLPGRSHRDPRLAHAPPRPSRRFARILLERIRPLWRRLGFLNKVTARNLFRYKKRFFMTVFGIMGCTALLICGFSIKNTVESLAPRQYDQIYRYDLMAVTMPEDFDACAEALADSGQVSDIEPIGVDNVTVEFDGAKESMQLYVIPRGTDIAPYVSLEELDGTPIDLDEAQVVMTNNAATVLGLDAGDTASITLTALDEADAEVAAVTRNYLGNAVYMTEDAYEELFDELELNGVFAHLEGDNAEQMDFADELEASEEFLSITSVAKMHKQFEESFTLINVVVYVVIGLAAGLAFVVLFTLSTVNIGEREREIATIKVLASAGARCAPTSTRRRSCSRRSASWSACRRAGRSRRASRTSSRCRRSTSTSSWRPGAMRSPPRSRSSSRWL